MDTRQTSEPVLDETLIARLKGIMGARFDDTARIYFDNLSSELKALEQATAAGNTPEIRRIAHALKGSSLMMGFPFLGTCFKQIESLAEDTNAILNILAAEIPLRIAITRKAITPTGR